MLLLLTLRNQIVKIMETGVRSKREMPVTQKTVWGKCLERVSHDCQHVRTQMPFSVWRYMKVEDAWLTKEGEKEISLL